jgi:DnaJ-class molecular chaperone
LIPRRRSAGIEDVSLSGSFNTYSPSFEAIFDRLMQNFGFGTPQKSQHAENLQVEVTINPAEAKNGGSIKLMIPVRIECPLCYGTRTIGFWDCRRCGSNGFIHTELPLLVSYPSGIQNSYTKSLSLTHYGIHNFYLTVKIHVSESP